MPILAIAAQAQAQRGLMADGEVLADALPALRLGPSFASKRLHGKLDAIITLD